MLQAITWHLFIIINAVSLPLWPSLTIALGGVVSDMATSLLGKETNRQIDRIIDDVDATSPEAERLTRWRRRHSWAMDYGPAPGKLHIERRSTCPPCSFSLYSWAADHVATRLYGWSSTSVCAPRTRRFLVVSFHVSLPVLQIVVNGTEWPTLCWCADKQLRYSLTH